MNTKYSLLNNLVSNPRQLFLVDALGAVVSAIFLGVVFVQLIELSGLPINVLYISAIFPCFFAVLSS